MVDSPEEQLARFMSPYAPEIGEQACEVLDRVRALAPGAVELVYDNYNALVVGFGPSERTADAILSVVLYPRWVTLGFGFGAALADPSGLLQGSGSRYRSIRLRAAVDLDDGRVCDLIRQALAAAPVPLARLGERYMVITSISRQQRPRRPL